MTAAYRLDEAAKPEPPTMTPQGRVPMRSAGLVLVPIIAVTAFAGFGAVSRHAPEFDGRSDAQAAFADLPTAFKTDCPIIHYAPAENLEKIDVSVLDTATHAIDMAAFTLTDYPVIEALARAAKRGVVVRILFDRGQLEDRPESPPLIAFQDIPGVSVRVKRGRVYMHLKSYQVDGRILRTGSANFSASGLKQQDNDLVLVESVDAAQRFKAGFDVIFAAGATE